jgi:hypothetical protein
MRGNCENLTAAKTRNAVVRSHLLVANDQPTLTMEAVRATAIALALGEMLRMNVSGSGQGILHLMQ